ncbi:MAG: leucine-rich repeat domain-containing protein, partial [Sodaliphilus sp.]|nr:leucine-rich repeat domain-containing protein [Bacteroidales bacterium]MDY4076403.1 leucine-rich repeat domain-containing protein [Sodaliphilus sp.]
MSINIPESVTEIGNEAFWGCSALMSINIPESVTEIGEKAFDECQALTSIIVAEGNKVYDSRNNCNAIIETKTNRLIQGCANTFIPESVLVIENYAFEGYSQLASITIPNSVTKIGNWAFEGCTALTSITIPNSVTKIGYEAFYECKNLKEIILFQTDPSKIKVTENSGLQKTQITLYVPKEGVTAFQEHWFWSECAAIKPITDDMIK